MPPPAVTPKLDGGNGGSKDGIYSKMTSLEAATHYMSGASGEVSTKDVADALLAGGFPTESEHFQNNVYTTLGRLADQGVVERVGRGRWRLLTHSTSTSGEQVEFEGQ